MDLRTKIGSLELETPIFNAAGAYGSTKADLVKIAESSASAVLTKSFTLAPLKGNEKPNLFLNGNFSINSIGLRNAGSDYYCKISPNLASFGKPVLASIAGQTSEEFLEILQRADLADFSGAEINLSCPNIKGKEIFAYDRRTSLKLLEKARKQTKKVLGVKLPPYGSVEEIRTWAKDLPNLGLDFVTLINTYPLASAVDLKKESLVISPNKGIGGLGGKALKPIALAQVALFHYHSNGKISIVGTGGIGSGADVYEFILAGASAIGIGTALWEEGPNVFERLERQLKQVLEIKKVKKLEGKIGKIKLPN